jgi:hypothetical protein
MMNRNQFLRSSVGFAAAMFGIGALAACKDDGVSSPPDASAGNPDAPQVAADAGVDGVPATDANMGMASCSMNGTIVAIAGNHGHVLVVSKADVAAGAQKMYSIQGGSLHDHIVTLTTADFAQLAANASVSTVSSSAGHTHTITVTCATS